MTQTGTKNERTDTNKVTVLGARGSIPVSGTDFSVYGGATSCVLLEADTSAQEESRQQVIVFDAGSGILNLPKRVWKEHTTVHVLLSHFHLDHLMGIPMSPMLFDPSAEVIFYAEDFEGIPKVFQQMMAEPLWPVGPGVFKAKISYRLIAGRSIVLNQEQADQGTEIPLTVTAVPVIHPGGAQAFRVDWGTHSMVYATDCDPDEGNGRYLERFAADTDLLILDAQYTEEEYENCRGFGHPSMRTAAEVIEASGAARGLFFHHAPTHTDAQLKEMEETLQQYYQHISYAREGDVITLCKKIPYRKY